MTPVSGKKYNKYFMKLSRVTLWYAFEANGILCYGMAIIWLHCEL